MDKLFKEFRHRLLEWGRNNTRKYPWRWIDDPYRILMSEFMLHRTQTKQVVSIYDQFIEEYPTLVAFSQADEAHLRDILKSLGLQWRIEGMLKALSQLWTQYGEVPINSEKLLSIEGIGQYIAGATVCFANNEPVTLIDTNIVRVVGRVWGLELSGEARRRKSVIEVIAGACDPEFPRDYYYSMIDFAHQVCKPRNPDCKSCPLLDLPCQFGQKYISHMGV